MSLIGNLLLLVILIPILIFLIAFIGFNSFSSKFSKCNKCGTISFGSNSTCINCGEYISNQDSNDDILENPSETTIEIKAEEVK